MTNTETNQQTVTVSPAVYQALLDAGLLVALPASEDTSWATYGVATPDDFIICTMIAGERFMDTE